ncbi:hypothetical protein FKM82_021687 [Ascaphus truei]
MGPSCSTNIAVTFVIFLSGVSYPFQPKVGVWKTSFYGQCVLERGICCGYHTLKCLNPGGHGIFLYLGVFLGHLPIFRVIHILNSELPVGSPCTPFHPIS